MGCSARPVSLEPLEQAFRWRTLGSCTPCLDSLTLLFKWKIGSGAEFQELNTYSWWNLGSPLVMTWSSLNIIWSVSGPVGEMIRRILIFQLTTATYINRKCTTVQTISYFVPIFQLGSLNQMLIETWGSLVWDGLLVKGKNAKLISHTLPDVSGFPSLNHHRGFIWRKRRSPLKEHTKEHPINLYSLSKYWNPWCESAVSPSSSFTCVTDVNGCFSSWL